MKTTHTLLAAAAVLLASLTIGSCTSDSKAKYDTQTADADSLAYYIGRLQGYTYLQSISQKQPQQVSLDIDSADYDQFVKGIREGATEEISKSKDAYMKGIQMGQQLREMADYFAKQLYQGDSTATLRMQNIVAGVIESVKSEKTDPQSMQESMQELYGHFQQLAQRIESQSLEKKYAKEKKAGEDYLAKNGTRPGVKTLEGGVQYRALTTGDGPLPTDTTRLQVNYEGRLTDGTVFDSSYEEGRGPITVDMAQPGVIPGWVTALKHMPAGSTWEVTIPYDQAYGPRGREPKIPPFATLIFKVEVLK